jgi:hypothetical protein
LLALAQLTTLALRQEGDRVTASVSLTVRWWGLAIAAVSVGLLLVLLTYAFLENFQPFHPIG